MDILILFVTIILSCIITVFFRQVFKDAKQFYPQIEERHSIIIEEGRKKHEAWEQQHPLLRHLFKYNANKYLADHR